MYPAREDQTIRGAGGQKSLAGPSHMHSSVQRTATPSRYAASAAAAAAALLGQHGPCFPSLPLSHPTRGADLRDLSCLQIMKGICKGEGNTELSTQGKAVSVVGAEDGGSTIDCDGGKKSSHAPTQTHSHILTHSHSHTKYYTCTRAHK